MTSASDNNQTPNSDDRLIEPAERQASDGDSGTPSPAGEPTATVQPEATARIPKRIGHYHVKRVLASGGMGTVYEAIQEKPRRTVALKTPPSHAKSECRFQ